MNNEVYVVKIHSVYGEDETLGICSSIETAYNLIKEEISHNWDYFQYCEEGKWRRITDTALAKSYELHNVRKYFKESDNDYERYDFLIIRLEVI